MCRTMLAIVPIPDILNDIFRGRSMNPVEMERYKYPDEAAANVWDALECDRCGM